MLTRTFALVVFGLLLSHLCISEAHARRRHRKATPSPTVTVPDAPYSILDSRQRTFSGGKVVLDDVGNIYLETVNFDGTVKLDPTGKPLQFYFAALGTAGRDLRLAGRGAFAVGSTGKVYSLSTAENDAQFVDIFDADGTWLKGYPISSPQALDIAIDSSNFIYVLHSGGEVSVYDEQFSLVRSFSVAQGQGPQARPITLTIDEDDNIYTIDANTAEVLVFDPQLNLQLKFKAARYLGSPVSLDVDSKKNIYVAAPEFNKIFVYSPSGKPLRSFGNESLTYRYGLNIGDGFLKQPTALAIDDQDRLFVTEAHTQRLQLFDAQGKFIKNFHNFGNRDGKLGGGGPGSFALTPQKTIMIADTGNLRIQEFDEKGFFKRKIGNYREPWLMEGQVMGPWAIDVDKTGQFYVSDPIHGQVVVYNPDGTEKLRASPPVADPRYPGTGSGFANPYMIRVNDKGTIYVKSGWGAIFILDSNGIYRGRITDREKADGRFSGVSDFRIGANGDIYVLRTLDRRLSIFDPAGKWKRDLQFERPGSDRTPFVRFDFDKFENIFAFDNTGDLYIFGRDGKLKKKVGSPYYYKKPFLEVGEVHIDPDSQKIYLGEGLRIRVLDPIPVD